MPSKAVPAGHRRRAQKTNRVEDQTDASMASLIGLLPAQIVFEFSGPHGDLYHRWPGAFSSSLYPDCLVRARQTAGTPSFIPCPAVRADTEANSLSIEKNARYMKTPSVRVDVLSLRN